MTRLFALVVLGLCTGLLAVHAQAVRFSYRHSLTSSGTTVDIVRSGAEVRAVVNRVNYTDPISSFADTIYAVTTDQFDEIMNSMASIVPSDVAKASETRGRDGTSCTIECDQRVTPIHYVVWSPDINARKRGTTEFLATCKLILLAAKLKPSNYF